jgi:hypothetical protein
MTKPSILASDESESWPLQRRHLKHALWKRRPSALACGSAAKSDFAHTAHLFPPPSPASATLGDAAGDAAGAALAAAGAGAGAAGFATGAAASAGAAAEAAAAGDGSDGAAAVGDGSVVGDASPPPPALGVMAAETSLYLPRSEKSFL